MAGNPIKYSELFQDDGGLDKLIQKINELEKTYKQFADVVQKETKETKQAVKSTNIVDPESAKKLAQLEKQVASLSKKEKELGTVMNQIAELRKKSIRLKGTEAEVEESLRLTIQKQTKDLKTNLQIVKSKEGSVKKLEAELKKNIETYKNLTAAERQNDSTGKKLQKTIQKQQSELTKLNKGLKEEKIQLTEVQKLELKSGALKTKAAKDAQKLKLQIQDQTRALKNEIIVERQQEGSLKKLEATLRQNIERYRSLSRAERENSKVGGALLSTIKKQDSEVKKLNETIGRSQGSVGNYKRAFEGLKGVFARGLGALGITAGLAGIVRVLQSSIGIFADFEKANSALEAVLGATDAEMNSLAASAKLLGATTSFTASEVTGLQTEFAKLGFPTSDILNMTESTLNAAAAMGSDLGETAKLTGAILKSYGLKSTEAARVNDVLAKSTSASALDFQKLSSSMSSIAPVAKKFGFSLEGTVSLLGNLSDAGFDASSAATATRKILLNLADSNGKLAKSLKEPVKDLPSLVKGLKQLQSEGTDLGEALELTDVKSVAAFATFLDGADDITKLNNALENAEGTAKRMADTQLDNLSGAITILGSAWEGFILSLEDGNGGLSRTLKNIVKVVTEVLSLLSGTQKLRSELTESEKKIRDFAQGIITAGKVIGSLVVGFVAYRTTLLATRIATTAMSVANKIATVSFKGLNKAMKANVIGLVVSVLATLIASMKIFSKETDKATKSQEEFNKEQERAANLKSLEERFNARLKLSKNQLEALKSDLQEELSIEEKAQTEIIARNKRTNDVLVALIKERQDRIAQELQQREQFPQFFQGEDLQESNQFIKETTAELKRYQEQLAALDDGGEDVAITLERIDEINKLLALSTKDNNEEVGESIKGLIEIQKELKKEAEKLPETTEKELAVKNRKIKIIDEEIARLQKLGIAEDELRKKREKKEKEEREDALLKAKEEEEKLRLLRIESTERLNDELRKLTANAKIDEINDANKAEVEKFKFARQLAREKLELEIGDGRIKKEALKKFDEETDREIAKIDKKFSDEAAADAEAKAKKKKQQQQETQDFIVNSAFDALDKIQEEEQKRIDKDIDATKKQITTQQSLAAQGLENTLAFEEAELAKQEKKKIESEKRQIRLEKIKALYAAYSSAASAGDDQAIVKVIRDFAIIQGLESSLASLGTGTGEHGTIDDFLDSSKNGSKKGNSLSNGVFKGESHKRRGKGIPLLVEGGEGILSTKQMNALGVDNFRALTESLDNGVVGSSFFGEQTKLVPQINSVSVNFGALESKLNDVKSAIENQPVQQVNVEQISKTYTDFIDTTTRGNKKVISRYRTKRSRL